MPDSSHAAYSVVRDFESGAVRYGGMSVVPAPDPDIALKIHRLTKIPGYTGAVGLVAKRNVNAFAVAVGYDYIPKVAPGWMACHGKRVCYMFDAWPIYHSEVLRYADRYKLDYLIVSASQAAADLQAKSRGTKFVWMPEPLPEWEYQGVPWDQRDVDVLQLGRKFDKYHQKIADPLAGMGLEYVYEKVKGQPIAPDHDEFLRLLGRSKISVCFPQSVTHPERAGHIETMTSRYLISMASGCLVLGTTPAEMLELFGYNPVIEYDASDPAGQIAEIVKHPEQHQELIERNQAFIAENLTLKRRIKEIVALY